MTETFTTLNPKDIGLEKSGTLEWIIPNILGGYSASNILDLPTKRHQALLVSACEHLRRVVFLEALEEEIHLPGAIIGLRDAGALPERFEFNHNSVSYRYQFEEFSLDKRISPLRDKNGVVVLYTLTNNISTPIRIRIRSLVNSREASALGTRAQDFETRLFTDRILGVRSDLGYLTVCSDRAVCGEYEGERRKSIIYPDNSENFCYIPAVFESCINGESTQDFTISSLAYETEEKTANAFKELSQPGEGRSRVLSSGIGSSILSLLDVTDTFIVEIDSKKTIISYPFNAELGREVMISLPGLTLINGRLKDAELIFERFLNHATRKGVPSGFVEGKPVYDDIDTTLWLIDRLYKYMKAAGREKTGEFLHAYWWDLKDMIHNYIELEKDGLLMHKGGTWMPDRNNAVEVQGLWYNALRIMEELSGLFEDDETEFRGIYKAFEENFLEGFWSGSHLKDTLDDDSVRPNQLIALALEFTPLNETMQKKVLNSVDELVTEYGIRTLSPKSDLYNPKNRFNGASFPWLLGSYIKILMILPDKRLRAKGILENIFDRHTKEAGIGTISEFFSGENLEPSGNISHAPAVAELTRAYFEDVMERRRQPPLQGSPQRL